MKPILRQSLLLCCLLALPLVVSAQETRTVGLSDGYSITIPADWDVSVEEDGLFSLDSDDISTLVTTPAALSEMGVNFTDNTNVIDVLINLLTLFDGVRLERDEVEKFNYNGRTAAAYSQFDDGIETRRVALTMSNGEFGLLTFIASEGDIEAHMEELDSIIASFDSADGSSNTASEPATAGESAAADAPCTVSAATADSAQLRVGPGTNRGAISFLPANTPVTATGRIVLEDGAWYQLDKDEAAPNGTPAAELWVWEEQVALDGDCENVGVTNAPPVIRAAPQVVSPPAGEGDPQPVPSTPAAGLLVPNDGEYTMTLAPVINASCTGGQNVPLATSEIYEGEINYIYYIEVIDDNSFYYGDDIYRRYPGSNSFDGIFTYEGGEQSSARIDVLSETMVHGEINDLIPYDGYSCAATLLFNSTLN